MSVMQDPYAPKVVPLSTPQNVGGGTGPGSSTGGAGVPVGGILGGLKKVWDWLGGGGGKTIANVGSVLGKQQQGASEGRQQQAAAQAIADRNAIELYNAQQRGQESAATTDLERKKYETSNRAALAKQALLGQLLGSGNFQGTSIDVPGVPKARISGGILESLNRNPEALKALMTMGTQAGTAQNTPTAFQGGEMVKPPTLAPVPQIDDGGTLDWLARYLELAGAAGSSYDPRAPSSAGTTQGRP